MSFVDHEETDFAIQKVLEKVSVLEPLRCEIEELAFSRLDLTMGFAALQRREMRVHCDCIDALCRELVLLVFHQGDEWAHDDGETGHQESRQLIDDRLAAASRHDD